MINAEMGSVLEAADRSSHFEIRYLGQRFYRLVEIPRIVDTNLLAGSGPTNIACPNGDVRRTVATCLT